MIKQLISFLLLFSFVCCLWSCNSKIKSDYESTETAAETETTETEPIEQTDADYIIRTDWMTFYFSKKDFNESDITEIVAEAISVMADVRVYLGVNYTLEEAEETVCYFDSTYRNKNGQKRSWCSWNEKKINCISLDDFVHEYVHMVSESNKDLVYSPSDIFSEGLAEHVSLNFYEKIASQQYTFFKEESVSKAQNSSEHQMICELLADKGYTYNAKNYNKAFVAILNKDYDISQIDKNSDFYKYIIGEVFVDYCVNELGGFEKFMTVYNDSITIVDVYEKSIDELVIEACDYNTYMFYK